MALAIAVFNFCPSTPLMTIVLARLNDIPILTIASGNTRVDANPVRSLCSSPSWSSPDTAPSTTLASATGSGAAPTPRLLFGATLSTALIGTLIAVYGVFMTPIGWGWAGLVWAYAAGWFVMNDIVKMASLRILRVRGIIRGAGSHPGPAAVAPAH